jgi:para-aminobenzoate synthetase/4-amino-4-deoxychorismate lyase
MHTSSFPYTAIIRDGTRQTWLGFKDPLTIFQTSSLSEVRPLLERAEAESKAGRYVVGLVSYEAGPAFDSALSVHAAGDFPLAWFAVFAEPEQLSVLPSPPEDEPVPDLVPEVSRKQYLQDISSIRTRLAAGDTYQVNHTFRMRGAFSGHGYGLFHSLCTARHGEYAAFIDLGRWSVLSTSPEMFFEKDGTRICSRPMKGTVARSPVPGEDLQRREWLQGSKKNRAENVMIVDMVRNDLGRICDPGTVVVPELFAVEGYPTVWQMTSLVTGQARASLSEIFAALFPASSITGAPKASTMEIIRNLEKSPRNIYTGTIGFLEPTGRARFNVAIRTVLVDREKGVSECGVGGGIVWDSDPEEEYAECMTKAGFLRYSRPECSLLETMLWTREEGVHLLERHLDRLERSAVRFGVLADREDILERIQKAAQKSGRDRGMVRLLVDMQGRMTLDMRPLPASMERYVVALSREAVDPENLFLYHKTTRRELYDRARESHPDVDDVLLVNSRGELTESCIANLVLELDGELVTPPVSCGLLPGTAREEMLAREEVLERVVTPEDLFRADRVLLVNSVRGTWEVEVV